MLIAATTLSPIKLICSIGSFTVLHLLAIVTAVSFSEDPCQAIAGKTLSLSQWLLIQGFASLGSCVIFLGGLIGAVKYGNWRQVLHRLLRYYVALVCLFMIIWATTGAIFMIRFHDKCVENGTVLGVVSVITATVQGFVAVVLGVMTTCTQ